jgi:hypothetical protein
MNNECKESRREYGGLCRFTDAETSSPGSSERVLQRPSGDCDYTLVRITPLWQGRNERRGEEKGNREMEVRGD